MSKKSSNKIIGICRICKKEKELNFEHFPPKSAFNNDTKYYSIPQDEFYKNAETESLLNFKPKGKQFQGGLGDYCLCFDCNNFLGSSYVREYKKWANIGMELLTKYNSPIFHITTIGVDYLKILKQIVAIFICNNQPIFTDCYPELIDFVKNKDKRKLSKRFRIYVYLNNEGQLRNGQLNFTNLYGIICEFTFRPFGYVLSIDHQEVFPHLLDITDLGEIIHTEDTQINMSLIKYPSYLPFPMDFRSKEEIKNCR